MADIADEQEGEEGEGEEVVQGDSDDIEGVKNDLEESLTADEGGAGGGCHLYTSPSPRDVEE